MSPFLIYITQNKYIFLFDIESEPIYDFTPFFWRLYNHVIRYVAHLNDSSWEYTN